MTDHNATIHIIDNRTPESIDTIKAAMKWVHRIADRHDQLPQSFTDNITADDIRKLGFKLEELARK